jgi:NCAIR mutase (PurE)-related protein
MSEAEINAVIAEACGWKPPEPLSESYWKGIPDREIRCQFCGCHFCDCKTEFAMRDYCNNLNAIHEAEKRIIIGKLESEYLEALNRVVRETNICYFAKVCATARQRAEALVKTVGKWRE